MIKVKEFFDTERYNPLTQKVEGEALETSVNAFIAENPYIDLVDIKYQRNISGFADGGTHGVDFNGSALMIYRVVSEDEKN